VGYAGGTSQKPSYHSLDGHSETIQIDYDPNRTSYEQLLEVFWNSHNPVAPSWSRQYASIIFYHDEQQKKLAVKSKEQQEAKSGHEVFTEIRPLSVFYPAEDYHQKYRLQNVSQIMTELRSMYPNFIDLVNSTSAARINGYLGGFGDCNILDQRIDVLNLSETAGDKLMELACGRSGKKMPSKMSIGQG
jgi:peptide-methionine (S)-S-oxide reductase